MATSKMTPDLTPCVQPADEWSDQPDWVVLYAAAAGHQAAVAEAEGRGLL